MLKTGIILEICEAFLQYVNSICRSKSRKICETLIAWNLKTVEDIDKKTDNIYYNIKCSNHGK